MGRQQKVPLKVANEINEGGAESKKKYFDLYATCNDDWALVMLHIKLI